MPEKIKTSFLPHKCKLKGHPTIVEAKEMINQLLNLFSELNLKIKNQVSMDLDDFLYFMDNFSFYFTNDNDYFRFLESSFA